MPGSDTYFLEVSAQISLKVATNNSFRDKKLWKFSFLGYFSKAKTGKCTQKSPSFSNEFRILMADSDKYFLEVRAHVSLKVATNNSPRHKKNYENLDI